MTIPFYCVFFSFVWIYAAKLPVGIAMKKLGGYDNRHGREQQKQLTGWGHRALAAHMNGFESFSGFASVVVMAHLCGADPNKSSVCAVTYLVSRIFYVPLYVLDRPRLRSTVWFVGILGIIGLFVLAVNAPVR